MISLDFPDAGFGAVQLSFSYGDQEVLREVDFHVMPGEIHALVGKQNEGKSTLCAVLTGDARPASGWLLAGGRPYRGLTPGLARGLGVEYVGKEARVFPDLTVAENIYMGEDAPWWRRFGRWGRGFGRVRDWLAGFGVELPYDAPIRSLRQEDWLFVELLNRLRRRPRLLIVDETLEQLSARRRRDFQRIADELMRGGMAVLWVTHMIEAALEMARRITVLRRGRVLFTDDAASIDRLGLVQFCYSEFGKDDSEDVTRERFYELMRFVEAMFRDMPAMVLVADLDGRIRLANTSARNAFPGDAEWIGRGAQAFLRRFGDHLADEVASALAGGGEGEWHGAQAGQDGMLVDVRLRGIQERGVRVGHMFVIEDVSVRETMRRRLALSDNLASVGLLAAGVAHEVNDPLAIINNYLGYIRHEVPDAEIGRVVRLAQEEIGRIQQIVDNLVAFSGNETPDARAVDVMDLAEELCNLLRFHTDARRVAFSCGSGELWIAADANEMRQVLLNLLRNALDAIDGDGEIEIGGGMETDASGAEWACLSVSDTGAGIRLENPEDIFKPFVTTKKGRGSHQGLGLSIVYGIVEKYGGRIHAENREKGGCRITLRFPACAPEE